MKASKNTFFLPFFTIFQNLNTLILPYHSKLTEPIKHRYGNTQPKTQKKPFFLPFSQPKNALNVNNSIKNVDNLNAKPCFCPLLKFKRIAKNVKMC